MKRIEVIINPEKKERLEDALENMGVTGVIFSHIVGYGNQKGRTTMFRGAESKAHCLTKLRAETVVPDDKVEKLIEELIEELQTGRIGDGKIFIHDVCDAVRIRTAERGEAAL